MSLSFVILETYCNVRAELVKNINYVKAIYKNDKVGIFSTLNDMHLCKQINNFYNGKLSLIFLKFSFL